MTTNWQTSDRIQGRWEIHKILGGPGKSGMGIVYVVYDLEFQQVFAAKTFQDEIFARDASIAERFRQEALTWINLDAHQNITKAQFVQIIEDKPYLFLEYVSGGDLTKWIGMPRLTEDLPQVLRFSIQFCDGMTHALSKGIVAHRDIKPQNCLISEDSILKISDFGLVRVFDEVGLTDTAIPKAENLHLGLTLTGQGAGTPPYMAPEQFKDAKYVDVRADIYSFGVMLYQMITGCLPFIAVSCSEFEQLHKTQTVPPLPDQAVALRRIVEKCLAKDPARRYGDFGEIRDTLAEIYHELVGEYAAEPVRGMPLEAEQWGNKGVNLNALGHREQALACFDRVIEINSRDRKAWANKAILLSEMDRPEEAIVCYDRALEINPCDYEVWSNKGLVLYKLGREQEAFSCYDRALAINPSHARTWMNKGSSLHKSGRSEDAIPCFDRGLAIDPRGEELWYCKGLALHLMVRLEEALSCYDRALAINSQFALAWLNKGSLLAITGSLREARLCYEESMRLGNQQAAQGLALLQILEKHLKE